MKEAKKILIVLVLNILITSCGGSGGGGSSDKNNDLTNENEESGSTSSETSETSSDVVTERLNCTINGKTIKDSESGWFVKNEVEIEGRLCQTEERTCNNGILSGSYSYDSCTRIPSETITFKIPDTGMEGDPVKNPQSFSLSSTGMQIVNSNTGSMFQRYPSGNLMTQSEGKEYCSNLVEDQYNNWRLPYFGELILLVDYGSSSGLPSTFPSSYGSSDFLSRNTVEGNPKIFNFGDKLSTLSSSIYKAKVICARGGSDLGENTTFPYKLEMFNSDIVSLVGTDLQMSQDPIKDWNSYLSLSQNSVTWDGANTMCNDQEISGFSDWRLPTIRELYLFLSAGDQILDSDYFSAIKISKTQHLASSTHTTNFGRRVYCSKGGERSESLSCTKEDDVFNAFCVRNNN